MREKYSRKYIIYILMVAYIIFVAASMAQLNSLADEIRTLDGIGRETRAMRARLHQLRNVMPGLMAAPDVDLARIEDIIARIEKSENKNLGRLRELFNANESQIAELTRSLKNLRVGLRDYSRQQEDNPSFESARKAFDRILGPLMAPVEQYLNDISHNADNLVQEAQDKVKLRLHLTIFITIIVGAFIVLMAMLSDRRDKAQHQQIAYREGLFNQLAQNVDEVFIVAANANVFDYVSPNSGRLLGVSANDIMASPDRLYDILPAGDAAWLRETLNSPHEATKVAERDGSLDDQGKYFKIQVYPICLVSAKREHFIVSISDQTRARLHQQALSDALETAHAASAAKSSFLSHMSHEIRTPMNAIIGMTTIAISRINDRARVEDCLGKISESSRHLLGLINDVLDMSKIESGKLAINHENFNLTQAIENIRNIAQPQTRSREQEFEILLENVEDEDLVGDALRLNQILLNILSNAWKFTPPGGKIILKIQQLPGKHNSARFRFIISDTGIGMSEEFLQRIYMPFEQASSNTAAKYGGTGLGMPITSNLIALMGGIISVKSREGHGTTFDIELPFGLGAKSKRREALPPLKVLIVDDDHGTCEHASLLLEKMGLQVRWCTSGAEAVRLARDAHSAGQGFDVCLIDWKMPDMDGAETARRMRETLGEDVLIIIISAYDWTPIESEARQAGVNDFIAKPFFASTLYNSLLSATRHLEIENKESESGHQSYDFSGKRVLLVEDNEFNREIGQEFLEMVNAEVENAENGALAVEKVLASPKGYYDLILMDVQMPIMNGYEATRAIRASNHPEAKSLVILAMTANAFSEDVAHAIASGMNGHLAKPIDVHELYRLMALHFKKKVAA